MHGTTIISGFVGGIALRSFVDLGFAFTAFFFILAVSYLVLFRIRREYVLAFYAALFFFSFGIGMLRFDIEEKYSLPLPSLSRLSFAKEDFVENIRRVLPEPHASLVSGITVGEKAGIEGETKESFRRTGTSHILVLSGYNITLVASFLFWMATRFFSHQMSVALSAIGITLFTILTGAEAATVRAMVMGLIALIGKASGRVYEAKAALFAAGLLMIILKPSLLVFDLSFQLSFLAAAGILFISPRVMKLLSGRNDGGSFQHGRDAFYPIKSMFVETMGAQIAVLPLILVKFGTVSLVSPFANVLIAPAIPLVMLLGFLTGSIGFVSEALSHGFAILSYPFLSYILSIAHFFSNLPFAAVSFM